MWASRGSAQGAQLHMLSQKDHKLATSFLHFVTCPFNCRTMSLTAPDLLV
jgi:hypothetical protein